MCLGKPLSLGVSQVPGARTPFTPLGKKFHQCALSQRYLPLIPSSRLVFHAEASGRPSLPAGCLSSSRELPTRATRAHFPGLDHFPRLVSL